MRNKNQSSVIEHNKASLVSLAKRCISSWPVLSEYMEEIAQLDPSYFKSVPSQSKDILEDIYRGRVLMARKKGIKDSAREQTYASIKSYEGDEVRGHIISLSSKPKFIALITDPSIMILVDVSMHDNLEE